MFQQLIAMFGSRLMSAVAAIVGGGVGIFWPQLTVRALSLGLLGIGATWLLRWYQERPK